jgi:hypothetical protein
MRSLKVVSGCMAAGLLLIAAATCLAEEPAVTGTATVGVFSKYIFRGYELSRGSIVVQPALTLNYDGFSASYWGNVDTNEDEAGTQNWVPDRPGKKSFNESDLTLSYSRSFGKLGLTGGYIYYGTKYADETEELFVSASYDTLLKPTIAVYRDITAYPGTYINLALSHSVPVCKEITLDLGGSVGYMAGDGNYWKTFERGTMARTGSKYSAFHDGMLKAGLTIPVTKRITFQPMLQYWFALSGKAREKVAGNSYNPNGYIENNLVGGANINFNF